MGSSGQKPRKGHEHQHLPKVGTKPNLAYEERERRKLYFGGWPVVLVVVLVALLMFGFAVIT